MAGPLSQPTEPKPGAARGAARRLWNSAWGLLLIANLFGAGNIIIGRVIVSNVPVIALSFWRWSGAFAIAIFFAWPHLKRDWPVLRAHWKLLCALAATGIAFFNTAAYIGLAGTTALNVLLMQSALPLIVTVWAFLLLRERPSLMQAAAVLVSMAGVAAIAAHGSFRSLLALRFHSSDLWVLASAIIYGVYVVLLRRRPPVHALSLMTSISFLGVCMVAPFFVWEFLAGARIQDPWSAWSGIAYMAIFQSFIAYLFFNRAVQLVGPARAGHSTHLIPILGSVMAVLFLGESFQLYHVAGGILIGGGIALAQIRFSRPVITAAIPQSLPRPVTG